MSVNVRTFVFRDFLAGRFASNFVAAEKLEATVAYEAPLLCGCNRSMSRYVRGPHVVLATCRS